MAITTVPPCLASDILFKRLNNIIPTFISEVETWLQTRIDESCE